VDGGRRRQADRPALGRTALQIAVSLEDLQVVMDSGCGGEPDGLGDLANRRRVAAGAQRRRDEVQDPYLALGVVLRHSRLLALHDTERTFDVKAVRSSDRIRRDRPNAVRW
jgi:hypothetical protein